MADSAAHTLAHAHAHALDGFLVNGTSTDGVQTVDLTSPRSNQETLSTIDGTSVPLTCFIGRGCDDRTMLHRLQAWLGDDQVCDLRCDELGRSAAAAVLKSYARVPGLRALVCGDDVHCSRVLDAAMQAHSSTPVGILPMRGRVGSSMDLSRALGWGGRTTAEMKSRNFLRRYALARSTTIDRWSVDFLSEASARLARDSLESFGSASKLCSESAHFYAHLSIGIDAAFQHEVHARAQAAEVPRQKCLDRVDRVPAAAYALEKVLDICQPPCRAAGAACASTGLCGCECAGQRVGLAATHLAPLLRIDVRKTKGSAWEPLLLPPAIKGVLLSNVPSHAGGRKPWRKTAGEAGGQQDNDAVIEVVGWAHACHWIGYAAGAATPLQLCQAAEVRIQSLAALHVAIDGQTREQPPMTMVVSHAGRAGALRAPEPALLERGEGGMAAAAAS